ncbi:MAG: CopG family transcriptional regulator [Deltaproteobacteria bacterium]|nr:CopG family transcriptional regulator [Deltaproteobacteria bacterium]
MPKQIDPDSLRVSASLPPKLVKKLKNEALKNYKSISHVIREALEEYFKEKGK